MDIVCNCDANFGDARDTGNNDKWKSQGGFLIFVGGCLVAWKSKRHRAITLSSMEAEYVEASNAAKEVIWFRRLLSDLGHPQTKPTVMFEDNKACIDFSQNNVMHDRSKHIDIKHHHLRELVLDKKVELWHVATLDQLADILTKHPVAGQFINMRDRIYAGDIAPTSKRMTVAWCIVSEDDDERVSNGWCFVPMSMGGIMCY